MVPPLLLKQTARLAARRHARLNQKWLSRDYILSRTMDFNPQFLHKNSHIQEIEHQVGRFLNMKSICAEITANGYEGDIVEFGTWQGTSLVFFGRLFQQDPIHRQLVGIDSFEGLPVSSNIWTKGGFDTSIDLVQQTIASTFPSPLTPPSVTLIKGWYNEPTVRAQLVSATSHIALVHFDSDLGISTTHALELITPFLEHRCQPIYFLFDDWGCHPDEVPDAFYAWLDTERSRLGLSIEKRSSTRFTRYYKLSFNKGD